jgi:hypothetical protein
MTLNGNVIKYGSTGEYFHSGDLCPDGKLILKLKE